VSKKIIATLILGTGFGLFYSVLLREISWLQKLELNTYDTFLYRKSPQIPPEEILLIKLDQQYQSRRVLSNKFSERTFYTSLIGQLLEHKAAVVVLNLRHYWRDIPDDDWKNADSSNSPLKNLVKKHSEQIVLVTPTNSLSHVTDTKLQIYNHFLPTSEDFSQPISPTSVQGFAEYELQNNKTVNLTSFARRVNLIGEFVTSDRLEPRQKFDSAFLLAIEKFNQQQTNHNLKTATTFPQTIGVNYWSSNIESLSVREICVKDVIEKCQVTPNLNLSSHVANKIVVVGFSQGRDLNTLPVTTSTKAEIPFIEFQGHILASLISDQYYRIIPAWSKWLIHLTGAIIVSGIVIFGMDSSRLTYPKSFFLILLGLIAAYLGLTLFFWQNYYTLPVIIPLSIWSASAISTTICLFLGLQKQLINNQQQTIEQLKRAEEKAVILQTRKLLQRIASDLHDTALQDLKILMDRLELESNLDSELIIDSLESIGQQIREELYSMRQMSQKLEVSSILRSGLDIGIRVSLEQLIDSSQLTLQVVYDLHSLNEPIANSAWIDAREDIYRFFREAISNVIFYAQPPYGQATQVKVSLWRNQDRCFLIVTDDNFQASASSVVETTSQRRSSGGYGTKIMETIASELPQGSWSRTNIPEQGTKIELSWNLSF
ncbi:MAG: CHASE2 domain-containing protein, partial [Cyanobacteria bacterium P01_A01_bin.83]